jgi:hypothetical protein
MVSNIRTNSSGLISTPLVAGLLQIMIKIRIASPMLRKGLRNSRSESFQCDAGKIVTASGPACCAQAARPVAFAVVGDTQES